MIAWGETRVMDAAETKTKWPSTMNWWIDAVGGYLALMKPRVRLGQAGQKANDIGIMADISQHHADIHRGATGVTLIPHAETTVNGKRQTKQCLLKDRDQIGLREVRINYFQPVAWSPTARLQVTSPHRLSRSMDGVLLLGETCILGPKADAHIPTDWERSVYITWHREDYWIRCAENLMIDGKDVGNFAPLTPTSEVCLPWGSFRWEPAP